LENRLKNITKILEEKKAENIEVIDVSNKNYITDQVVIATALNNKHSLSLVNNLRDNLKPLGEEFLRVDEDENWSIIDLGDIIIHIMTQNHRDKYDLEDFLEQLNVEQK